MHRFFWMTTLCGLLMVTGCQSVGGSRWSFFTDERGGDRENSAASDPWVREAGDVARNELPKEDVGDPLGLRNYFVSEKARDIERNLGVGN